MAIKDFTGLYDDIILAYDASPERRLWVSVLKLVVADLEKEKPATLTLDDEVVHVMSHQEIMDWIDTADFRFICKAVGCRPHQAANQLRQDYGREQRQSDSDE